MLVLLHEGHDLDRLGERLALLVGPVRRGERLEDVGDRHHPCHRAHLVARQALGVARAIHFLVMAASDLRHAAHVLGERQVRQHDHRLHDVLVDLVAILVGERAARDREVVQLPLVVEQLRHVHAESVGIVLPDARLGRALEEMLRFVVQKALSGGQWLRRRAGLALALFVRNPRAVIDRALPGARGDRLESLDLFGRHEFAALVAGGHERVLLVQRLQFLGHTFARTRLVNARGNRLQAGNFGVALEHFEAHPYLMDTVVNGLELGRLVHHVFGRGDLAAIVQPRRYVHGFPVVFAQTEIRKRALGLLACRVGKHFGELGHALAVTARIGALGVDRACDELDERLEQGLLRLDQLACFERTRGRPGERLDERHVRCVEGIDAKQ